MVRKPQLHLPHPITGEQELYHVETELSQIADMTSFAQNLNKKADAASMRSHIGLGSVENTADSAKKVAYADNAGKVNNHTVNADVPAGAKFTDTTYAVMPSSELTAGTSTQGRLIDAHTLAAFMRTVASEAVDSAPEALDTLAELARALGNDPNFATTVMTEIGKKLDKSGGVITGNLKVNGTLTGNISGSSGSCTGNAATATSAAACTGNAATATKLATARTINIQDSSATNTGTGASFDGSGNATIKLPATIKANITGNCTGSSGSCTGNAATATKLATARTINIQDSTATNTGTGASFDGSGNATIKLPAAIKANLTGNVTGNCSGSSGSCTGNAATATKIKDKTVAVVSSFDSSTGVLALVSG